MISTLKTWEQRIVREIYGPIKDQNGRKIVTNDELQVMYRKLNIVTTIKARPVIW
jgi:hypothetical protein